VGEGAAGSQGGDAWSWLAKDVSGLTADEGDEPRRLRADGALRSAAAAASAARGGAFAAALEATVGTLLAPGAPAVVPGSTIAVAGAPRPALNGSFLVRRVRHRFSKRDGFTTLIAFSRPPAAGGGGAAGALGGLL
jgi:phage protein D